VNTSHGTHTVVVRAVASRVDLHVLIETGFLSGSTLDGHDMSAVIAPHARGPGVSPTRA
jgi:hypothetical protein